MKRYHTALSIAGSDPSGGAGLQADLKTFSALCVYGTTVVVAVVDENTRGVYGVHPVPPDFVKCQIHSVLSDVGADAVKIGMLHDSELIRSVLGGLKEFPHIGNIVLDPVMVATSGDPLLESDAIGTLASELIPYARIITPNLPEASMLLGTVIDHRDQFADAAKALSELGGGRVSVMLKAGHMSDNVLSDYFYDAEHDRITVFESYRVATVNTHGTGCTLSSAIAAGLAKGMDLIQAVAMAKKYIGTAIECGADYKVGYGHGPVHHFHAWW